MPATEQDQINLLTGALTQVEFATTQIGDGLTAIAARRTEDATTIQTLKDKVAALEAAAGNNTDVSDQLGTLADRATADAALLAALGASAKDMGKDPNTPVPTQPPTEVPPVEVPPVEPTDPVEQP